MIRQGRDKSGRTESVRFYAYRILLTFEQKKPRLDDLLDETLRKSNLNSPDRRLLKSLTSGVVRHVYYLDWLAGQLYFGNYKKALDKEKVVLRLGLYELVFLKNIPARATLHEYVELAKNQIAPNSGKRVNAILRTYLREGGELQPDKKIGDPAQLISILHSFPLWLVKRWIEFWGEDETAKLCAALNQPPQFDLIVNEDKISFQQFQERLAEARIEFLPSTIIDNMIMVSDIQGVIEAGLLEEGCCAVQDESAAIPGQLLQISTDDVVLDVCAAPGGKYLQILRGLNNPATLHGSDKLLTVKGMAIAADVDLKRLKRVRANVQRMGPEHGYYVVADGRHLPFKPVFTRILLDAPCSGLGVIRKHPDIKWRRSFSEIMDFSRLQSDILLNAAQLLRAGGALVYSTCTIDYLENENVVESFLSEHSAKYKLLELPDRFANAKDTTYLRTFPHHHQSDGSFCAILQKIM